MTDLPPPDLIDSGGRLRRLFIALFVGAAVATIAYLICDGLAKPDEQAAANAFVNKGPYRFVWYMTGFFGAGAFGITLAILNRIADKKYRDGLVARARVVR